MLLTHKTLKIKGERQDDRHGLGGIIEIETMIDLLSDLMHFFLIRGKENCSESGG